MGFMEHLSSENFRGQIFGKILERARRGRLPCRGGAFSHPDSPGLTYECKLCFESARGRPLRPEEAFFEEFLRLAVEVMALPASRALVHAASETAAAERAEPVS